MNQNFEHPVSIAPMMQRTDRFYRYFMRQISKRTLLYTEMVTGHAVVHGDRKYLLGYDAPEKPIALQLGGDQPEVMAEAAIIGQDWGYDEININVGCPSDRVQSGNFGACLMKEPETVARCWEAMQDAVDIPVTVKHRIGVDEMDRYEHMHEFVRVVSEAGCERFTVHARKAWLQGLSPKENRNVPPLRYAEVHRLKEEFPSLTIEINGGIRTLQETAEHLERVDAVMIGRAAYDEPWLFAEVDPRFYGDEAPSVTRHDAVEKMFEYADWMASEGLKLSLLTRHMINLFNGMRGAKAWRRHLSENAYIEGSDSRVIADAMAHVSREPQEASACA